MSMYVKVPVKDDEMDAPHATESMLDDEDDE